MATRLALRFPVCRKLKFQWLKWKTVFLHDYLLPIVHNQSISLSTDIPRPLLDFLSWRSSIFVLLSMCLVGTGGILVLGRSSVAKTIVKRPRTDILLLRSRASLVYYKKLITRLKDYKNIGLKIKRSDWVILVIAGLFV